MQGQDLTYAGARIHCGRIRYSIERRHHKQRARIQIVHEIDFICACAPASIVTDLSPCVHSVLSGTQSGRATPCCQNSRADRATAERSLTRIGSFVNKPIAKSVPMMSPSARAAVICRSRYDLLAI